MIRYYSPNGDDMDVCEMKDVLNEGFQRDMLRLAEAVPSTDRVGTLEFEVCELRQVCSSLLKAMNQMAGHVNRLKNKFEIEEVR